MDFLYSVITRPIANEPDKKSGYAVQPAYKDGRAKVIGEDEEERKSKGQQQTKENDEETIDKGEEANSSNDNKGKGLYRDEEGRRHLDFYA